VPIAAGVLELEVGRTDVKSLRPVGRVIERLIQPLVEWRVVHHAREQEPGYSGQPMQAHTLDLLLTVIGALASQRPQHFTFALCTLLVRAFAPPSTGVKHVFEMTTPLLEKLVRPHLVDWHTPDGLYGLNRWRPLALNVWSAVWEAREVIPAGIDGVIGGVRLFGPSDGWVDEKQGKAERVDPRHIWECYEMALSLIQPTLDMHLTTILDVQRMLAPFRRPLYSDVPHRPTIPASTTIPQATPSTYGLSTDAMLHATQLLLSSLHGPSWRTSLPPAFTPGLAEVIWGVIGTALERFSIADKNVEDDIDIGKNRNGLIRASVVDLVTTMCRGGGRVSPTAGIGSAHVPAHHPLRLVLEPRRPIAKPELDGGEAAVQRSSLWRIVLEMDGVDHSDLIDAAEALAEELFRLNQIEQSQSLGEDHHATSSLDEVYSVDDLPVMPLLADEDEDEDIPMVGLANLAAELLSTRTHSIILASLARPSTRSAALGFAVHAKFLSEDWWRATTQQLRELLVEEWPSCDLPGFETPESFVQQVELEAQRGCQHCADEVEKRRLATSTELKMANDARVAPEALHFNSPLTGPGAALRRSTRWPVSYTAPTFIGPTSLTDIPPRLLHSPVSRLVDSPLSFDSRMGREKVMESPADVGELGMQARGRDDVDADARPYEIDLEKAISGSC